MRHGEVASPRSIPPAVLDEPASRVLEVSPPSAAVRSGSRDDDELLASRAALDLPDPHPRRHGSTALPRR
jgi:hypothetical protein